MYTIDESAYVMMTQTINIVINFGRREPLTEHRAEYDENRWALVVVPKHQKYITYVVYIFKRERERRGRERREREISLFLYT